MADEKSIYTVHEEVVMKDGVLICQVIGDETSVHEDEENAARIAACLNACRGISNPVELREQRDELLATLKMALGHCEYQKHNLASWHIRAETIIDKIKEVT